MTCWPGSAAPSWRPGLDPFDAGSVGSWLHGAAATEAGRGGPLSAPAVAAAIPTAVRDLLR